jgi:hypothetical protein
MFVLNILEHGVEGIKLEYLKNSTTNFKKIVFLNNIVAERSNKKSERLSYLKKLNRDGLTFYTIMEKDAQNITNLQWDNLYRNVNGKNKKILARILQFVKNNKYTRSKNNSFTKTSKMINKTKKKI